MKKVLLVVFLILGTVIGSGFSTGKEIVVFFSRFGYYSFLFIPIAFVLFYFVFLFLMTKGRERLKGKRQSKLISILMLLCATIFSSSMFAGIENCMQNISTFLKIMLFAMVFALCFFACFKELKFLSGINLLLIPFLLIILATFFVIKLSSSSYVPFLTPNFVAGFVGGGFFCVLYVVLNISLSSVVIAKAGEGLTKKQTKLACFFAAFVLSVFILIIDVLVLCNYDLVNSAMPLLAMSEGVFAILLRFVIMVGCLTTLFSMVFVASSCCKELSCRDQIVFLLSVLLPFFFGKIGFSYIVSFLYPIASYLGVILLFLLFFWKGT